RWQIYVRGCRVCGTRSATEEPPHREELEELICRRDRRAADDEHPHQCHSGRGAGVGLRDALWPIDDLASLAHRADELDPLAQEALRLLPAAGHLLDRLPDVAGPEVVPPVEGLDRLEDLVRGDLGVGDGALLIARLVDQAVHRQELVLDDEVVEPGARIGRRERDLEGLGVHVPRETDRLLDRTLRLPREAEDEGAVDQNAELVAVLGEAARALDAHALPDVLQDLLVARLVADDEEPEPAVLQDLEDLAVDVRAG